MTIMSKCGQQDNVITYKHVCDTLEDRAKIDPKYITLGTTCTVINGSDNELQVYIANSNKQWNLIKNATSIL